MFKESKFSFQNQIIDSHQSYSYPINKSTITRYKNQKRSSPGPFFNFLSPKKSLKSQKFQKGIKQTVNHQKKAQNTVAFMKNYVDKLKRQRKINQKKRYSQDNQLSVTQQIDSYKLPQFIVGGKKNLQTIQNGIYTTINSYTPQFLKYKRQKSDQLNMETQREKERISQLLKQIKKDKQKMSRMLSPIIHSKSKKGSIPILQKQINPPIHQNPFNEKVLQPWKQDKKGHDFQIQEYQNKW